MIHFGYWAIGLILILAMARCGFLKVTLKGMLFVVPFFTIFPWAIGYGIFEIVRSLK